MSLALEHITLTYPDANARVTALDDVTLAVDPGTLAMVIGPSGSGKSSLLSAAAMLVTPDSGTVTIDGIDATTLSARQRTRLRRERIGFVFQQPQLLPALTAAEQLQVMRHLGGRTPRLPRAQAVELLDAVGLADLADRRPAQLSGGQRQRINIARALVNEPAVLLVDEPTSALDHDRGLAVLGLLRGLTEDRDLATVIVTHDTKLITAQDRVLTCRDGRLEEQGLPALG